MKRALVLSGGGARGAFQVGVLKYLNEINWQPDLIIGTSVGAINAVAIGSGMSIDQMTRLWQTYRRKRMFTITLPILLRSFKSRQKFSPMSDTRPLKKLLESHIDIDVLKNSKQDIFISTLNMITGQLAYFNQHVININHIMAASAIPGLFGWQTIDGIPYWDAGLMVNTPITPALKLDAKEIVVVLHSPVGAFNIREPRSHMDVAQLVFEHFLIGSYTNSLPDDSWEINPNNHCHKTPLPNSPQLQLAAKGVNIAAVAPTRMLGLRSLLNFSLKQANTLIDEGYNSARMQLKSQLMAP
ncbi:MAG: patatin-like phospholipase family protein [Desulfobacteraceae bacterium]|jgi:NTE family protein|nr:patatin-like phospholipase family protein [Desulfobacteraceae bacterium]